MATKPKSVQKKAPTWAKIVTIISLALLAFIGYVVNDNESQDQTPTPPVEQKEESKPVQKTEEAPKFIKDGKLVWQIPVCRRASDYNEYSNAVADKDYETTRIYEKRHLCFMLKPGVKVSVLESHLFKPTKIRVYQDGNMIDLYTSISYVIDAE